mmetsp:Transcript_56927/g.51218  ORF Transcript_56927/g.51218 Transcript_56927/m.51218 type:complete len:171 (-) Transcript_56927:163-675(-)
MADNPGRETDPLEIAFDKAFPQSDELEAVRNIQNLIYSYSRKGLFNLLSVLIGMVLALAWGLLLGLIQFLLIWFLHPALKVVKLLYGPAAELIGVIMNAIYGKCLSNISSRQYFNWGSKDDNNNGPQQPVIYAVANTTGGGGNGVQLQQHMNASAPANGIPLSTDGPSGV